MSRDIPKTRDINRTSLVQPALGGTTAPLGAGGRPTVEPVGSVGRGRVDSPHSPLDSIARQASAHEEKPSHGAA